MINDQKPSVLKPLFSFQRTIDLACTVERFLSVLSEFGVFTDKMIAGMNLERRHCYGIGIIGAALPSEQSNLQTAAMSKRKADEAFGEDANDLPHWPVDLPDEVTHKIETTLACPKSVTAMEATCKAWRRILQKNDVGYWKPKALERFPRLSLICKARESKIAGNAGSSSSGVSSSGVSGGTALGSWKKLYWRQLRAEHRPQRVSQPYFKPLTDLDDYAFTVEFRLDGKMLFEETFTTLETLMYNDDWRCMIVGPELWSYQFPEGRKDENEPLDPRLTSRLGSINSKDPFLFSDEAYDDKWEKVTVDVIVHRLSDLASVKLLENAALGERDGAYIEWERKQLSCRAYFVKEGHTLDEDGANLPAMYEPLLAVSLEEMTGKLILHASEIDEAGDFSDADLLKYFEVQCPWPTSGY